MNRKLTLPLLSIPFLFLLVSFYVIGDTSEDCVINSLEANPRDKQGGQYQLHTVETTCGDFTIGRNFQRGHVLDNQVKPSTLTIGETYTFDTTGYRFAPFKRYPHIIKVYVKDEAGKLHVPLETPIPSE